jgi:hypothetical protein
MLAHFTPFARFGWQQRSVHAPLPSQHASIRNVSTPQR